MFRATIVPRTNRIALLLAALVCVASPFAAVVHAAPDLIAVGSVSATYEDFATETAAPLEKGVPGNRLGGIGSGLAYAGGNTFLALPDRGPNAKPSNSAVDDTTSYIVRFHTLSLSLAPSDPGSALPFTLTPMLVGTTLLSSKTPLVYGTGAGVGLGSGAPALNAVDHTHYFTGRADNFDPSRASTNPFNARLDPEGIRVANDGRSLFISDEYGPYVYEFDRRSGKRLRAFTLPSTFAVSRLSPVGADEISGNTSGRIGMAIHCGAGGGLCAGNPNARADLLPDEPGGYNGFLGLFGAKYVNPVVARGSAVVENLNGQPITDQFGQPGFPGFDGLFATTTLSYVAQMQEAGIPVTFGYISDAHDQHGVAGEIHATRGPGEADYVQQLKNYDEAFGNFFARLAAAGIDKSNTLFVFTVEEGDHFVGGKPTPADCDGVNTPCTYSLVGEINGNLAGLLATEQGITTPFTVHADMAPTIYLTGNPARTTPVTRAFGRALGQLTAVNPYTAQTDHLSVALADPVGMKALHMVTADPQRTPTLVMFAHPDYFLFAGAANCSTPCITVPTTPPTSTFAWNHGGIQPEIATTWLGLVGPGVRHLGDDPTWADHTDVRPTMLALLGLKDSYEHDGRVLIGQLDAWAVPQSLRAHRQTLQRLGEVYKQLNAPFGRFGMDTLAMSTKAVKSGSPSDDSTYTNLSASISSFTDRRDELAKRMKSLLDDAAFHGESIKESEAVILIVEAEMLLDLLHRIAQH